MSVLVKGMEMPQNCDKCRFQSESRLFCDAMPYNFCGYTDDIERPDWCPLIEVPPHGDLVDRDALLSDDEIVQILTSNPQRTGKLIKEFAEMFVDKVNRQPTIIEAERSEI